MTEEDARQWISVRFGVDAVQCLATFVNLVCEENRQQNLISPASVPHIWTRHVLDSAQLVLLASVEGLWLDIGTGGGFPGLVVGILRRQPIILVESRKRRAAFLDHCVRALGLDKVKVTATKVEALAEQASIISARAVASVENLLHAALPCATKSTRWLLPRGRSGKVELAEVRQRWRGVFHVEQSLTDPDSSILILEQVRPR